MMLQTEFILAAAAIGLLPTGRLLSMAALILILVLHTIHYRSEDI